MRKGELTRARIARSHPHQVAIDARVVAKRFHEVMEFKASHGAAPRDGSIVMFEEWHSIIAFADKENAGAFIATFGGQMFDPAERGKGTAWAQWKPKAQPVKRKD